MQALRNRLLISIIKEKAETASVSEPPKIAISFYEELKFRHDQAEQVFRNTVECLLKHYDKKVRKYANYMKKRTSLSASTQDQCRKRVMEFDTKIGQKWIADLDHQSKRRRRDANPLRKYPDYEVKRRNINISDRFAGDQDVELKKWIFENQVPDITDKEKDAIDSYVFDVFQRDVESTIKSIEEKEVDLNPKDAAFVKRILDT
ncbi:651_t:CDS:2 [Paraglomus occultum]|uniref:651_t:CDS:1 n=1 Tax=Paraglomus occultum TaxID=144539 RepID=A0A9N8VUE3_9GLOM|nr:651_t:CDS:2 [Paraglomus occultum]